MSIRPSRVPESPRRAPDLRLVPRRVRFRAGRGGSRRSTLLILALVCTGSIVFAVLLEQVALGQSAFRLAHLRERLAAAEARHEELLLRAARLGSAQRIERVARGSLGMVDPNKVEYVVANVPPAESPLLARAPAPSALAAVAVLAAPGGPGKQP